MRRAAIAVVCLFTVLFAGPAVAQLSGGLDGKWSHHVVHLAEGGLAVPVADVWLVRGDETLMVWRSRAPLDRVDLSRSMLIERAEVAAPPPSAPEGGGEAAAVQRAKVLAVDADARGAHLYVRDGIADALVELRLPAGCVVGCAIDGIAVTVLPGSTLLAPGAPPRVLQAVDGFPLSAGDVQFGK